MDAEHKSTILLHLDILGCLEPLTMEQRGAVISTIVNANGGRLTVEPLDVVSKMAFFVIQSQIDREYAAYLARVEKRRAAARARWDAEREQQERRRLAARGLERDSPIDPRSVTLPLDDDGR